MSEPQVVVITGAAGGIGSEIARQFARKYRNLNLVLIDHPDVAERLEEVRLALPGNKGPTSLGVTADIAEFGHAEAALIGGTIEQLGRVDVLINAAGVMPRMEVVGDIPKLEPFVRSDVGMMGKIMAVNFWGTVFMCRLVLPHMQKADYGRIVNISSIAGLKADPGNFEYAASKVAVISLTRTLSSEAPFNRKDRESALDITVNVVCPGITDTSLTADLPDSALVGYLRRTPQHRKILPAEVANTVLYLASKEASGINGADLTVDGGYMVAS